MTCILGMIAEKDRLPWHMITITPFSNHRVKARNFALFSNAFETSPGFFCPFSLAFLSSRTMPVGGGLQGAAPRGRGAKAGDQVQTAYFSLCQEENLAQLISAGTCGVQPVRSLPAPRYPQRAPVVVDVEKIQARRYQVLAAMEVRPWQPRKGRVAGEFDAAVLVISTGSRGWATATPDDVFYLLR